jgi:hypothetical protein
MIITCFESRQLPAVNALGAEEEQTAGLMITNSTGTVKILLKQKKRYAHP